MKISILSNNLSENGMYRVYNLGKVLQRRYEVEIIGPIFGENIYKLFDAGEFQLKSVQGCNFPNFFSSIKKILNYIVGDVIYAYHPIFTSYGVGLLKKLTSKRPVIVCIDDWPKGHWLGDWSFSLRRTLSRGKRLINFWNPTSPLYSLAISEFFTSFADNITVTSRFLQKKFGGILVPHAQDTNFFDPSRYNRDELRRKWKVNDKKIIMFLGTPLPYKGVEDIIYALDRINTNEDIKLMIVGIKEKTSYVQKLINIAKEKIIIVEGFCPIQKVPEILSVADLIVIPQKNTPITQAQIPAKLIDAMAMAKPIISTNVSDIPEILNNCGMIVEPGDIQGLADKICYLLENEQVAKRLGQKAREKCEREFSFDNLEKKLSYIFDSYK